MAENLQQEIAALKQQVANAAETIRKLKNRVSEAEGEAQKTSKKYADLSTEALSMAENLERNVLRARASKDKAKDAEARAAAAEALMEEKANHAFFKGFQKCKNKILRLLDDIIAAEPDN